MKAVVIYEPGGPEKLIYTEVPIPDVRPGWSLVRITEGDRVLVRGGTSGVGIAFLRLVKSRFPDVHVAGSSRSEQKKEMMLAVGYDEVILESDGKLETEDRFDKVLELIGPATLLVSINKRSDFKELRTICTQVSSKNC